MEYLSGPTPAVGWGGPVQPGRDWYTSGQPPPGTWNEHTGGFAYMIRAVVDPIASAVGGIVAPANTFAIVTPWLAVIAIAGCLGTVVVVAKKRQFQVSGSAATVNMQDTQG